MFRILLALLALATSLLADDRENVVTSAQPATKETPLTTETNSATKNGVIDSAPLPKPSTPSSSADADSTDAADFSQESSGSNPWLYIMVGFLLVTGALLYVDPRIF